MSANCSVCNLLCEDDKNVIKCSGKCGVVAHVSCVTAKTRGSKREWMCDTCKPEKDSASVSSTKTSSTAITKEFLVSTLNAFKDEVFNELKTLTTENFKVFKSALEFFSDAVDTANGIMKELQEEMKSLKEEVQHVKDENRKLRTKNDELETRLRDLEQYSRINNIEISGVPHSENEDMKQVLKGIARAMKVEMKEEAVEAAHRVPTYNRKRPSSIIVKFKSRQDKEVWINGFKTTRPVTADRINPALPKEKVYVNEHLSPANKVLLARTKEAAKFCGYKYVWTKDGKIFVRKDSGDKIKKIINETSLDEL